MEDQQAQIISEISQILDQYRREVPGRRRAFPESVKGRVAALQGLGLSCAEIARQTKLPYYTVIKWTKKRPSFDVVRVVNERSTSKPIKSATVTKPTPVLQNNHLTTVTISMPGGIRIEGVNLQLLVKLFPTLGGQ